MDVVFEANEKPPNKRAKTSAWKTEQSNAALSKPSPWSSAVISQSQTAGEEVSHANLEEQVLAILARKEKPSLSSEAIQTRIDAGISAFRADVNKRQDDLIKAISTNDGNNTAITVGISREEVMTCLWRR